MNCKKCGYVMSENPNDFECDRCGHVHPKILPSHKWQCPVHGSGFGNLMDFQCPICGRDLICIPHRMHDCEPCKKVR